MTLSAYNLNTQYQRTELQYEAKISSVNTNEIRQKKENDEKKDEIVSSNIPVIYTNESDLSDMENIRKQILEQVLGGFSLEKGKESLLPNDNLNIEKETYQSGNPYSSGKEMPRGLYYSSSSEYYEMTSIEFSAQARIKTPNGEYNIELKFSFTQEFYEKNETEIRIANENFKNPFEINLDKDNENLKDIKYLHFIFASFKEEKNEKTDIFEQLRDMLTQREKNILDILNKEDDHQKIPEKKLDNFQIFQENSKNEFNLLAVQKDGVGVFLANSNNESSSFKLNVGEHGYSLEASYSKSSTSYMETTSNVI